MVRFAKKYSLADLIIGHCVEFTIIEGKLSRFLILAYDNTDDIHMQ